MYSQHLQDYIQQLAEYTGTNPETIDFLHESMACFVTTLGRVIGASTNPVGDLLTVSVRLLLISDGLTRLDSDANVEGIHYLVGLGFEQTGELLARLHQDDAVADIDPMQSDLWCGLTLATLHYLAGGYRVQALSVLRKLIEIANNSAAEHIDQYLSFVDALSLLYAGRTNYDSQVPENRWSSLLLGTQEFTSIQDFQVQRLAQKIRQRRDIVLASLGQGDEADWLAARGISDDSINFWAQYLQRLEARGISTFTKEQVGDGFDTWLKTNEDLLVILPTGSGKTIIGELRTALALAQNHQVIWLLPTRALVRQTTRGLREAFEPLDVIVEELPTTEDFMPLFAEGFERLRHIAVTTPEKLESLLRSNPDAVHQVKLIIVDEAQILLDQLRGTTAEFVLQQLRSFIPTCDIILMSAFDELKESLRIFLTKLGKEPKLLTSPVRPTRRMYGVISNAPVTPASALQYPTLLLYPPGLQADKGETNKPFQLTFNHDRALPSKISATNTASRIVAKATVGRLRTVLFVKGVGSTETQANSLLTQQKHRCTLPDDDLSRLYIELGRPSVIEGTSEKGIAPHHAGLTPLEQVLVEKWVQKGIVSTVVATPTLAQGVNLPFDFSVITYTSRRDKKLGINVQLTHSEIRNMLGRAGRAGYVSDGVGLISVRRQSRPVTKILDSSRHYFFREQPPSTEALGLSRLAVQALQANVNDSKWLLEFSSLSFTEAQRLVHFVLYTAYDSESITEDITTTIQSFPSIQQLSEEEVQQIVNVLVELGQNIRLTLSLASDDALTESMRRTGMPTELLAKFIALLRSNNISSVMALDEKAQIAWADEIVFDGLSTCMSREWYRDIFGDLPLEMIFKVIHLWRSGHPLVDLEMLWESRNSKSGDMVNKAFQPHKKTRINLGRFLNHDLSLIAQFWGALAVCYEAIFIPSPKEILKLLLQQLPACTREGVASQEQLEWLHALGGVDRVLAHELSKIWVSLGQTQKTGRYIRSQVRFWREKRQPIPPVIDGKYRQALQSIINM